MKKVVFVFALFLCSQWVVAQNGNLPGPEEKRLKLGFGMGVNHSIIIYEDIPGKAYSVNDPGIRLGIFAEYEALNFLFIAPRAELSFNNGKVDLSNQDGSNSIYEVMPISLDLMAHFIIKKEGGRLSPYFLIGPNFKIPLSQETVDTTEFPTAPDFAIDFGIGVDKAFRSFCFAPELRYSYGLLNVSQNPRVQSLGFHSLSLVLNFKG
jgi:hypothetical protein